MPTYIMPNCSVYILGLAISILSKDKRRRTERADGGVGGRKLIIITRSVPGGGGGGLLGGRGGDKRRDVHRPVKRIETNRPPPNIIYYIRVLDWNDNGGYDDDDDDNDYKGSRHGHLCIMLLRYCGHALCRANKIM